MLAREFLHENANWCQAACDCKLLIHLVVDKAILFEIVNYFSDSCFFQLFQLLSPLNASPRLPPVVSSALSRTQRLPARCVLNPQQEPIAPRYELPTMFRSGYPASKREAKRSLSDYELKNLRKSRDYKFHSYLSETFADEYFQHMATELKTLTELENFE
jgi:hypothetical protein